MTSNINDTRVLTRSIVQYYITVGILSLTVSPLSYYVPTLLVSGKPSTRYIYLLCFYLYCINKERA